MAELGLDLGPHAVFIWAAYAVVVGALGVLTAWIVFDERRQRRLIAELEAQGVTRRSARVLAPGPANHDRAAGGTAARDTAARVTAAHNAAAGSASRAKGHP